MKWLGIAAIIYLGLVVAEIAWLILGWCRFNRSEQRCSMITGLPEIAKIARQSVVARRSVASPKRTTANLTIHPRNLTFAVEPQNVRWWLGRDPVATAFYNALSASFPCGERFFMDSVRHFRGCASGVLKEQIAAFLSQEAQHTREHIAFNSQVAEHNLSMAAMQARAEARLAIARTHVPLVQLGETIALEHCTAILAHALLSDPRHLAGASNRAQTMWRWHAIEEIEHKSVAYDTFFAATHLHSGARRWALRVSTMMVATWLLFATMGRNVADSFTADGINRPATWARLFRYLLVKPGILRQVLPRYLAYFLPGFHPWQHDNRALMTRAEQSLERDFANGAAT
jgi:hypothetical protein